jgi:anti-anti-sigma factor
LAVTLRCNPHHLLWEAVDGGLDLYPMGNEPPYDNEDWFRAEDLGREVDQLAHPEVYVDLSRLQYLNAAGMGAILHFCLRVHRRDGRTVLCGVQPLIQEYIRLVRLDSLPWFIVHDGPVPSGRLRLPEPDWLAWNGGIVTALARTIAERQDFALMPVLGDALEEAGCTVPGILEHCRLAEGHHRNCWLTALLLKSA